MTQSTLGQEFLHGKFSGKGKRGGVGKDIFSWTQMMGRINGCESPHKSLCCHLSLPDLVVRSEWRSLTVTFVHFCFRSQGARRDGLAGVQRLSQPLLGGYVFCVAKHRDSTRAQEDSKSLEKLDQTRLKMTQEDSKKFKKTQKDSKNSKCPTLTCFRLM